MAQLCHIIVGHLDTGQRIVFVFFKLQQIIGIVIRQVNLPATNLSGLFVDGNNGFGMIAAS